MTVKAQDEKTAAIDKRALPEVLTLELDGSDAQEAALLMEKGCGIKRQIGTAPKGDKPGSGLLRELDEATARLMQIQLTNDVLADGIRHGRYVFASRYQDGRETLDKAKLKQELLLRLTAALGELQDRVAAITGRVQSKKALTEVMDGLDVLFVIEQAFAAATKHGDPFPVRMLEEIEP